jgi:sterol desaturase/sphingolipid hydroxylase (fatty acid hydroxylase superfamily)
MNKFLYKHFHSWHHRLYVPYAFGALYNHPVEGFALDTCSALAAQFLTGMTARQAAFFFAFSTFKTIDDHCGYNLPFDPLQFLSNNNADYHDIHHQVSTSDALIADLNSFGDVATGHWNQIQLCTTVLCALGFSPWYKDDPCRNERQAQEI